MFRQYCSFGSEYLIPLNPIHFQCDVLPLPMNILGFLGSIGPVAAN